MQQIIFDDGQIIEVHVAANAPLQAELIETNCFMCGKAINAIQKPAVCSRRCEEILNGFQN